MAKLIFGCLLLSSAAVAQNNNEVVNILRSVGSTLSAAPSSPAPAANSSGSNSYMCRAVGAYRLELDAMHGGCDAATSAAGRMPSDAADCPTDAQTGNSGDMAKYELGSKADLGGSTIGLKGAIDCSGFISAGNCRSGIPIVPGDPCKNLGTKEIEEAIDSHNSCYSSIPSGKSPNLQPGDLIEYQHSGQNIGHVFAIERTDPSNCQNFCIIQAASSDSGVGITCTSGPNARSDEQSMALKQAEEVNCGSASDSSEKAKVVRYNPQSMRAGCQMQSPKKFNKEPNCNVGSSML